MTVVTGEAALAEVVREHAHRLAEAGIDSPEADAFALAEHVLGLPRHELRTRPAGAVPSVALGRLAHAIGRRAARIPLQHLTGVAGFRTLELECRPGVFVPRPETETLAGFAVDHVRAAVDARDHALVVEPCTGTGAVALSVAVEVSGVELHATDHSPDAVALARANVERVASRLAAGSRVEVHLGDLLGPVPAELEGRVDVLVCNPPYLTAAELAASPPEVRDHEPIDALVSAPDGNGVILRLLEDGLGWLRPGGQLLVETVPARAAHLARTATRLGWTDTGVRQDLSGQDRIVTARRPL